MNPLVLVVQVKLLESFKKVANDDVRRDAAEGKCVSMSQPDTAARQWELCEQQRAWQEALEHENLIAYRKQTGAAEFGREDQDVELSLETNSDWSQEGDVLLHPAGYAVQGAATPQPFPSVQVTNSSRRSHSSC